MMRQSSRTSADGGQSSAEMGPGAVINSMCQRAPLPPNVQAEYLASFRAGCLAIRGEIGRFPLALEIVRDRKELQLPPKMRREINQALDKTGHLWERRSESGGEEWYAARLDANRDLFMRLCAEVQRAEARPYTAIRSIELSVRDFIAQAHIRMQGTPADRLAAVRTALEREGRVPCAEIVRAHGAIEARENEIAMYRDTLVEANLRLVAREALRFSRRAGYREKLLASPVDLFLDGATGLVAAVDRYLPEFNAMFSTYALHWIRQGIMQRLGNDRLVAIPRHTRALIKEVSRTRAKLSAENGAPPSAEEVYSRLNLSDSQRQRFEAGEAALRLVPRGRGAGDTTEEPREPLVEYLPAREEGLSALTVPLEQSESLQHVVRALERLLPPQVRDVIVRRYLAAELRTSVGERPNLQSLGREQGVSRETVRLREEAALATLTDYFIVLETPLARRSVAMTQVLSRFEQRVVDDLFAESSSGVGSEQLRRRCLRRVSAAIVIGHMTWSQWCAVAEDSGLSSMTTRRIAERLGVSREGWGAPEGDSSVRHRREIWGRAEPADETVLERLAPPLREWWRNRQA